MDNKLNMDRMDYAHFLIGQLTAFSNRYQTVADRFFEEISWKQCFALICILMFEHSPTINELSEVLGSSHQNVKQLLLKLEKNGYIEFVKDETDKRKQRIIRTKKAIEFDENHREPSKVHMNRLFENVDNEKLKNTIETLVQLEQNLKNMEEFE